MAFGLTPEILDAIDVVFLVRKLYRMVDPHMYGSRCIEDIVLLLTRYGSENLNSSV